MYIEPNNIINKEQYETIKQFSICGICKGILYEPYQCQQCENGFCKKCLDTWEKESKTCPYKCEWPSFKESRLLRNMLSVLKFKCDNGCDAAIPYEELFHHYDYSCSKINYEEKVQPLIKKLNELEMIEKNAILVNEKLKEKIDNQENEKIDYKEIMSGHPRYKQRYEVQFNYANHNEGTFFGARYHANTNFGQNQYY